MIVFSDTDEQKREIIANTLVVSNQLVTNEIKQLKRESKLLQEE